MGNTQQPDLDDTALTEALDWAKRCKTHRENAGLSHTQLAWECGVSSQYIYQIENGKKVRPSDAFKNRMARALRCEVWELFPYATLKQLDRHAC